MKTIELTNTQYKLLIHLLNDLLVRRSDCGGCNDVEFEEEIKILDASELQESLNYMGEKHAKASKKEWEDEKESGRVNGTWEDALKSGWNMFDDTSINYLIKTIKKQQIGKKK